MPRGGRCWPFGARRAWPTWPTCSPPTCPCTGHAGWPMKSQGAATSPWPKAWRMCRHAGCVSHDWAHWRSEVVWMTAYFSVAVWLSLTLVLAPRLRAAPATTPRLNGGRAFAGARRLANIRRVVQVDSVADLPVGQPGRCRRDCLVSSLELCNDHRAAAARPVPLRARNPVRALSHRPGRPWQRP